MSSLSFGVMLSFYRTTTWQGYLDSSGLTATIIGKIPGNRLRSYINVAAAIDSIDSAAGAQRRVRMLLSSRLVNALSDNHIRLL